MTNQIWDPEVLARLQHLHLRARQLVAGLNSGTHLSKRIARNVEFADYKEYSPGDPIRDLDWRVFGRSDRLVVRRQQAETELAVTFVLDASADMATGARARSRLPDLDKTKFGAAATLTATMAYYLQRRNEPVGLAILGGEQAASAVRWIPPRRGRNHFARMMTTLAAIKPAGTEVLASGFAELGTRMRKRSLLVVVSDLMEEPEAWGPMLTALSRHQVDLRVAHITDQQEMALDYKRSARFYSLEGGTPLSIEPDAVKGAYAEVVAAYQAEVRRWLASRAALHVPVLTHEPLDKPLSRLLQGV